LKKKIEYHAIQSEFPYLLVITVKKLQLNIFIYHGDTRVIRDFWDILYIIITVLEDKSQYLVTDLTYTSIPIYQLHLKS